MTSTPVNEPEGEPTRLWPAPRGRHRRPRPRKVLFTAGGLALAAGVLSLVRLGGDPGGAGGLGATEAEPRPDPGTDIGPDRPANVGATVAATPTAPAAMGGPSPAPTPAVSLVPGVPGAPTSVALTPGTTYTPAAAAPAPTRPTTARATAPPAPTPGAPASTMVVPMFGPPPSSLSSSGRPNGARSVGEREGSVS